MSAFTARMGTVVLSAALVVAGLEAASYAANGQAFSLGGSNRESRPSSLTNTGKGPALSLHAKGAPLAVSNGKKIVHLNADSLDGRSAEALRTHAITYTIPSGKIQAYSLDGVKPGFYLASFDVALDSNGLAECGLAEAGSTFSLLVDGPSTVGPVAISGTAVILHPSGRTLLLGCSSSFAASPRVPNTVALVPLGEVVHQSVVAMP